MYNMKNYSFEKFTQKGQAFAPRISLRKDGALGISQGALRKFKLTEGDWFVVLHYDRSANAIGLNFTQNGDEEGAIKLIKRETTPKGGSPNISASVSARAFLEFFGIFHEETQSYRAFRDEDSGLVVIELGSEKAVEERDVTE
jgi:hypothetical protein